MRVQKLYESEPLLSRQLNDNELKTFNTINKYYLNHSLLTFDIKKNCFILRIFKNGFILDFIVNSEGRLIYFKELFYSSYYINHLLLKTRLK